MNTKKINMDTAEVKPPFTSLRLVKRIAVLLLVITIITFYALSIQFIIQ
ncbi:MAG: hypothetical protein ACI9WT_002281 [Flavobacterium sp.]|jgi:hypothetical protein